MTPAIRSQKHCFESSGPHALQTCCNTPELDHDRPDASSIPSMLEAWGRFWHITACNYLFCLTHTHTHTQRCSFNTFQGAAIGSRFKWYTYFDRIDLCSLLSSYTESDLRLGSSTRRRSCKDCWHNRLALIKENIKRDLRSGAPCINYYYCNTLIIMFII